LAAGSLTAEPHTCAQPQSPGSGSDAHTHLSDPVHQDIQYMLLKLLEAVVVLARVLHPGLLHTVWTCCCLCKCCKNVASQAFTAVLLYQAHACEEMDSRPDEDMH